MNPVPPVTSTVSAIPLFFLLHAGYALVGSGKPQAKISGRLASAQTTPAGSRNVTLGLAGRCYEQAAVEPEHLAETQGKFVHAEGVAAAEAVQALGLSCDE